MAERRMFSKSIVLSDAFLDMPASARALYTTLCMLADDEGFINSPRAVMRQSGASDDDMKLLIAKKFVLAFPEGIVLIKHWRIHNYIRSDRKHESKYKELMKAIFIDDNNSYTLNPESDSQLADSCQSVDSQLADKCHTEVRLGKDSINKNNIYISDKNFSDLSENVEKSAENAENEFERRRQLAMQMAEKRKAGAS